MANRKISISAIEQVQVNGGAPVNLFLEANAVAVGNAAEPVRVTFTLTSDVAAKTFVRLTLALTAADPEGANTEVKKRHRRSDTLFTKRKRVTPGTPTTINIPKGQFDDADTVYIIQLQSKDGLAIATRNVYRA
jgi:hypothetical protein